MLSKELTKIIDVGFTDVGGHDNGSCWLYSKAQTLQM